MSPRRSSNRIQIAHLEIDERDAISAMYSIATTVVPVTKPASTISPIAEPTTTVSPVAVAEPTVTFPPDVGPATVLPVIAAPIDTSPVVTDLATVGPIVAEATVAGPSGHTVSDKLAVELDTDASDFADNLPVLIQMEFKERKSSGTSVKMNSSNFISFRKQADGEPLTMLSSFKKDVLRLVEYDIELLQPEYDEPIRLFKSDPNDVGKGPYFVRISRMKADTPRDVSSPFIKFWI